MSSADSYSTRVAAGVRAELARQRRRANELVPVIGLTRNHVYRRVRGEVPFDLAEIEAVASFLGVPIASLAESPSEVA